MAQLIVNNLKLIIVICCCLCLVSSELKCSEDEKEGEAVNLGRKTFDPEDMLQAFPEPGVCGKTNATFSKVVHGKPAKLGAFPWMALLGYKCNGTIFYLCGGTLISVKHVLTAAHCVHGLEDKIRQVRLGELDIGSDEDGATPLDVNVKSVIKHEDYSKMSLSHDIAIIALEEEVTFTGLIKPICLPMENATRMYTFVKYQLLIAGWGSVEYGGAAASHLQVAPVTVKDNKKCADAYSNRVIDDSVVCAGSGGRDACQGDSGGPLMMYLKEGKSKKRYIYQIGVVSFGRRCATGGYPGVYAKVGYFMPWLEQKIISA